VALATAIEAVRVKDADGVSKVLPWDPHTWYLVRDDYPVLEFLTRGEQAFALQSEPGRRGASIQAIPAPAEVGMQWHKWDFTAEVARHRRLGEITFELGVPQGCVLRCYVIPTKLLSYRDIVVMVEEIREELGIDAAWDTQADRSDKSWSQDIGGTRTSVPSELIRLVEDELHAALAIRRTPFEELAVPSLRDSLLAENALVSHWAARRSEHLRDMAAAVQKRLESLRERCRRGNSENRQQNIDAELIERDKSLQRLNDLRIGLSHLISGSELATPIYPSPLLQRDHKVRLLLRVFAPPSAQAVSEQESVLSHFPPIFLNDLWELWGAVWLAKEFRRLGFTGFAVVDRVETIDRCSWRFEKDGFSIEFDYEAEPALIDYSRVPPAHERTVSTMEWAARNQELDEQRPYLAMELRSSPDYLVRITTPAKKALMVGDACLASPDSHGVKLARNGTEKPEKPGSKAHTVALYQRSIGWAAEDEMVECHPLGGFVLFPPPAASWHDHERLLGATDCTLLCPRPGGDREATRRLQRLLKCITPELEEFSSLSRWMADDALS
jgi:hypothetical protein